jgi:hypothetical protein
MWCDNCGSELASDDAFCGMCGAPSRMTGNGPEPNPVVVVNSGVLSSGVVVGDDTAAPSAEFGAARNHVSGGRFFSHAQPRHATGMTNATRYLSAIGYIDPAYCGRVIRELVFSHRAVAPSIGIDLGVIVRHCLRARRMQMARDIVLSILLLAGLIIAPLLTIFFIFLSFFIGFLPSVKWSRKSLPVKIFGLVGSVVLFLNFLSFVFFAFIAAFIAVAERGILGNALGGGPGSGLSAIGVSALLKGALFGLAIVATQVVYTYFRTRTLCDELAPGADKPRSFSRQGDQLETRLAQIEGAQHGNVILYANRPFIGTGLIERTWSIAIELQRLKPSGVESPTKSRDRDYAPIDPVELHQVIRERLLGLRDPALPPNEQVQALTVHDHVVGPGWQPWDSPLIDQAGNVPYSEASPEAVDALIRHPQAGMRYYQRVTICDSGQAVWYGPEKVIDGTDLEIATSAFIYTAVEGRMFYLEFVSTVLPPLHTPLHYLDLLPRLSPGWFLGFAVKDSLKWILRDLIYAPVRAVRSLGEVMREGRVPGYPGGASVSVREEAAADRFATYIQKLDAVKYTKLVERLITDTVMDYLKSKRVNISEFVRSASMVINNNGTISNSNFVSDSSFTGNNTNIGGNNVEQTVSQAPAETR